MAAWARARGKGAAGGGKWKEGRGPGAGEMTDGHTRTLSVRRRDGALEREGARGGDRLASEVGRAEPRTPIFLLFNLSGG